MAAEKLIGADRLSAAELRSSRAAWWSEGFTASLLRLLGPAQEGPVLDVGSGVGALADNFRAAGVATKVVGIDIALDRLAGSTKSINARATRLPFAPEAFSAAVAILTLQHIPEPVAVVREMIRVTRPNGIVLGVEADNLDQHLYLPGPSGTLDQRYAAFWRTVAAANPGTQFCLGPQLLIMLAMAGLSDVHLEGFLVTHVYRAEPATFFADLARRILALAERYSVIDRPETEALLDAIETAGQSGWPETHFYATSTTPLFLATGRVGPAG